MIHMILPAILAAGLIIGYVAFVRIPVKYAVRIEDTTSYSDAILVKEAWHTGTGWEQVGDTTGYYKDELFGDVKLTRNIPPTVSPGGNYINTYLCRVQLTGSFYPIGESTQYTEYYVLEWYPIYPVKRNTILPSWFFPDKYLSNIDFMLG